ncbi:hypothetical protein QFZ32_000642 [Streptomyces canus]|uniref:Flp pilus-assembly TadG-like N-terminal domain-containing protein n=2 Tax=Streptomyces canus TaxID=58343 RepID=A0AAW8F5N6_9ACTN|nr:hypothetical protein [Streptomyces canus]MDQ0904803.1 hypothetical protein [Streptomyces canus]MDQ1065203.1 hypothetical protein [Streptomyces canus]
MLALMVPLILVLLAAGTLMIMYHRQNDANGRRENEALEQIRRHAKSYEDDVQNEAQNGYPSEDRTGAIAQRNHSSLISYGQSAQSLTTVVEFFATYEDTSFFGTSPSRAYRCYVFRFQPDAKGGTSRTTLPVQECNST